MGLADNGYHEFIVVEYKGQKYAFDNMNPEGVLLDDYLDDIAGYNPKTGERYTGQQLFEKAEEIK